MDQDDDDNCDSNDMTMKIFNGNNTKMTIFNDDNATGKGEHSKGWWRL